MYDLVLDLATAIKLRSKNLDNPIPIPFEDTLLIRLTESIQSAC
jgi:hypothetical protein